MRFLLLILFFAFQAPLSATTPDSIRVLLPHLSGSAKIDALLLLAEQVSEKDSLLLNAYSLSKANNYLQGEAKAMLRWADYQLEEEHFSTAHHGYQKAEALFEQLDDVSRRMQATRGIIRCDFQRGKYEVSLETALELEKQAKAENDLSILAFTAAHIGRVKGQIMKDYPAAQRYLLKSLSHYEEIADNPEIVNAYNHLGIVSLNQQQFDKALEYYRKGLAAAQRFQETEKIHLLRSNIANTYIDMERYDEALDYSLETMETSKSSKTKRVLVFDYLTVGLIYLRKNQLDKALEYAKRGQKIAEENDILYMMEWSYELQKEIYKQLNNYPLSLEYTEKMLEVRDSMNNATTIRRLAEREAAFEIAETQRKVEQLEEAAYYQRLIRNGIIILASMLILSLLLFLNRQRLIVRLQKQKLDRLKLIQEMKEKEQSLLKEKLAQQERILASTTVQLLQKNEMLQNLQAEIGNLMRVNREEIKPQIKNLNRTIEQNMNFDDDWQKFKLHFEQVHPDFFEKLGKSSPNLSNNDIRFCAYMKMGLTTKEIAQLMGINASSVQKARYRLKRKLNLEKTTNLLDFIQGF